MAAGRMEPIFQKIYDWQLDSFLKLGGKWLLAEPAAPIIKPGYYIPQRTTEYKTAWASVPAKKDASTTTVGSNYHNGWSLFQARLGQILQLTVTQQAQQGVATAGGIAQALMNDFVAVQDVTTLAALTDWVTVAMGRASDLTQARADAVATTETALKGKLFPMMYQVATSS